MRTPIYHTRTLLAGARATIQAIGKYVTVVSVSASTVQLSIDDESPEQITPGMQISVSSAYRRLTLVNAGAVATTVVLYTSDERIDFLQHTALALIAALLTPATTRTAIVPAAIAQTGVGSTSILAAAATRREALIQGNSDNAGRVWLANTNAVTQAASLFELLPGASLIIKDTVAVWACSENGTETVRGYEIS